MKIFDAHISGSLSVSSSAEISNDLLVSGNLNVLGTINGSVSGNITSADTASFAPKYTLTSSFNTYTSSVSGRLTSLESDSGSIRTDFNLFTISNNSTNTTQNSKLTSIEGVTGSIELLNTYTGSNNAVIGTLQTSTGSLNTFTSSASGRLTSLESTSSSIRLDFNSFTSSYNTVSGSINNRLGSLESFSGSYTGSFSGSFKGDGINLFNIPASGVTGLNLTRIADGAATASISNTNGLRVNSNTEITGALTISGSISLNGVPVGTGKLDEITFNSYTSSNNSTNSTQNSRLTSIESTTSSLNTFSSSIDTTIKNKLNTETVISGSIQVLLTGTTGYSTFSSSISTSVSSLSSSVATTTLGLSSSIESLSSSVATTTSGLSSSISSLSSSVATTTSGLSSSIGSLSSSIATTTLGTKNRVDSIETSTGSLNSFTSSINTTIKDKMNSESVLSGSIQVNLTGTTGYGTFSSSIATTTNDLSSSVATTTSGLSSSIGSLSSSVATTTSGLSSSIGSLSSSIATTTLGTKNRVDSIEAKTGSYATTGSNNFQGTQTITGSLYISQNLIVQGSSSLENITASAVSIGTNTIVLNTDSPAFRYAGISVFDSGSTNITASLFYDSLTNQWKFKHMDTGTNDASIMLFGPLGNDIDNAPLLDGNYLTKVENNGHGHHLTTSNIFDNGSKVSINSNTEITGTLKVTGNITNPNITAIESSTGSLNTFTSSIDTTIKSKLNTDGVISGSVQVNHNTTTNYVANQHIDHTTVSITAGSGLTGGGDISSTRTINVGAGNGITVNADDIAIDTLSATFTTGVKSKLNSDGVISGSAQVLNGTTIHSGSFFNGITVVSGSAQIDLTATTNYSTGIKTRLNTEGVVSGSSQITLSSTTGFGTYLNQALLTTSTPTFSTVSATTFTGALSGNATTATTAGALTSMNISQFTNNSAYLTGITSGNVTTALGFTPYNATNPSGYISSYTETSTLQNVITRGATTNTGFIIENGNSTYTTPASTNVPVIYMHNTSSNENAHAVLALRTLGPTGGDPFVSFDINGVLGWTVGIDNSDADKFKIGKSWATVGTNTYFTIDTTGNSVFAGTISATNFSGTSSGTNTGDQTIPTNNNQLTNGAGYITSYTETDTLASVTGRGASTSTAISINNTLTVTSGRIIARTGGANTYGIFSGYDNNNHMMSFRAAIAGSTSSPTITAGHQTTFIEYAEANDTTGWFFKSASTGTYEEIAKITRIGITPGSNGTQNLGSSSLRWNTVFTSDLSLSNGIGDYTIVEGENDLFLYNNKQNKVYKFMLQEVNPNDATPKRPE
jgi:hypothetical protein